MKGSRTGVCSGKKLVLRGLLENYEFWWGARSMSYVSNGF